MKILLLVGLLNLAACSKGSGVYKGYTTDVSWEGWVFKSCEVTVKTSQESSHQEYASSKDKGLCNELQSKIGSAVEVRYTHYLIAPTIDTNYEIDSVKLGE